MTGYPEACAICEIATLPIQWLRGTFVQSILACAITAVASRNTPAAQIVCAAARNFRVVMDLFIAPYEVRELSEFRRVRKMQDRRVFKRPHYSGKVIRASKPVVRPVAGE